MKPQKEVTAEQIYRSNRKKAKWLKILTPTIFWLLMATTLLFFCLTIRHSVGNVIEITDLLDKEKYTGTELQENYSMLKDKWGEWTVFGDDGAGISIKYINVAKALFSGLMKTYTTLTCLFFVAAISLGKIILPMLLNMYTDGNSQLIDIATLKTMEQVNEISGKKK